MNKVVIPIKIESEKTVLFFISAPKIEEIAKN